MNNWIIILLIAIFVITIVTVIIFNKCSPKDCKVSWSNWSECDSITGKQITTGTVVKKESCNGKECGPLTKNRTCISPAPLGKKNCCKGTECQTNQDNCTDGWVEISDCTLCGKVTCCNNSTHKCKTNQDICNDGWTEISDCNTCVSPEKKNCCDSQGNCTAGQDSCKQGENSVSNCSECVPTPILGTCKNPYYGTGNDGIDSILPSNDEGVSKWFEIFPILNPKSYQYRIKKCDTLDASQGRPDWAPGCKMWGSGKLNGLTNFKNAVKMFPGFCSGSDKKRNIIELAAFLGNVTQETGDPSIDTGLVFSSELGSSINSMFGKGALQLTGAINYQSATMGLNSPSDYRTHKTIEGGTLTGNCATDALDSTLLGSCWDTCVNSDIVNPPKGSGFNLCKNPSLASSDPIASWSSSLWYWMNRPIADESFKFLGAVGNSECATAHNIVQDPSFDCGEWCGIATIATVGCPSCCVGPSTTLDQMTVNRVGGFIKIAGILGLEEAQPENRNSYFCRLVNACSKGSNSSSNECKDFTEGISYDCYINKTCQGGSKPICGNVEKTTLQNCVPNSESVTTDQCIGCQYGQSWWPCNQENLCKWK
jgi:hypothetical protein